jgi:hypothetical protein
VIEDGKPKAYCTYHKPEGISYPASVGYEGSNGYIVEEHSVEPAN